jgi:hypothetical protein
VLFRQRIADAQADVTECFDPRPTTPVFQVDFRLDVIDKHNLAGTQKFVFYQGAAVYLWQQILYFRLYLLQVFAPRLGTDKLGDKVFRDVAGQAVKAGALGESLHDHMALENLAGFVVQFGKGKVVEERHVTSLQRPHQGQG